METVKNFFGIETSYKFELFDITTVLTILNVIFIFAGAWFAPLFGLASCALCLTWNIKNHAHINGYLTQIFLVALNIKFLMM